MKKLKGLIQILDLCILHKALNSSISGNHLTELTCVLQQYYRIFPSLTRTQYFPFSRTFLIDTAHRMYTPHLKIQGIVRLAVARPVFRYFGIFSILIA
jgi:hypothetical protein